MNTRLTLFTATLVQDSALSVSGIDRETTADRPFAIVNGVPTLPGRALKGAAVAMARRFFDPLPRVISCDAESGPLVRSAWEFSDATPAEPVRPVLRAGVGIRQKTGARVGGILYDQEVIPAGTRWNLTFRVDWSQIALPLRAALGPEAEGILGYVLAEHWAKGRCWLGGGVSRGLGWCRVEDLRAYRFDDERYEEWVRAGRPRTPAACEVEVPTVSPTRSWYFRTLDVDISFGEYRPDPAEPAWGLDMFAVGPHDAERTVQPTGDGQWARPAWASYLETPETLTTDRALLMDRGRPLLPGASVRGPLRHAYSRLERASGREVTDPHLVQGNVRDDDPAGRAFGTTRRSSRILIWDARAEGEWAAAKLHMHAEDEFSAGSFGSAKRDAVRLLKGTFPVRIVVEGPTAEEVESLVRLIDRQVGLGALGHLFLGGHKTRGAGAGRWCAKPWVIDDVRKARDWTPPDEAEKPAEEKGRPDDSREGSTSSSHDATQTPACEAWVRTTTGTVEETLTLCTAARLARASLGEKLVAWWCEPTIDLDLAYPPAVFGRTWPLDELHVDEVAFFAERAVWRAARTASGTRFVLIEELDTQTDGALKVRVEHTPARLHGLSEGERPRFSAARTGRGAVLLREWHAADGILGYTLVEEQS